LPQRIDKEIAQLAYREKRRLTNDLLGEQAASNCNGYGDSGIAGKTRSTSFPCPEASLVRVTHIMHNLARHVSLLSHLFVVRGCVDVAVVKYCTSNNCVTFPEQLRRLVAAMLVS